jgi:hypothetical protein
LVLEVDWKFASTFSNLDNDIYVRISDPTVAEDPAPTFLLYNIMYISSSITATNEIVQQNYKGLNIYPAFWRVSAEGDPRPSSNPYFFKVTGTITAEESSYVGFWLESTGMTFFPMTGGEPDVTGGM